MVLKQSISTLIVLLYAVVGIAVYAQQPRTTGESDKDYATRLYNQGQQYFEEGKYFQADSLYMAALQIRERLTGKQGAQYAEVAYAVGETASETYDFAKAADYINQAIDIWKKKPGPKSLEYAQGIYRLGVVYLFTGNVEEGRKLLEKALAILEGKGQTQSLLYANVLRNMGTYYFQVKKFEEAEKYNRMAVDLTRKVSGSRSLPYARSLISLSSTLLNQWEKEEMENLLAEASSIYVENDLSMHPDMLTILINQASRYMVEADYSAAEKIFIHVRKIALQSYSRQSFNYMEALKYLSAVYSLQGKQREVEPLMQESLELRIQKFGEESQQAVEMLVELGYYYTILGDYAKAGEYHQQAQQLSQKHGYREFYRRSLSGQGHLAHRQGNLESAIGFYFEALEQAEKYGTIQDQAQVLNYIVGALGDTTHDLDEEFEFLIEIAPEILGPGSIMELRMILNHGNNLYRRGLYAKSEEKYKQVLAVLDEKAGQVQMNEIKLGTLSGLGMVMQKNKEFAKASDYDYQTLGVIKEEAAQTFSFLPERERESFWNTRKKYIGFCRKNAYDLREEDGSWAELAYDNELLAKNLLLLSSVRVRNAVVASGDEELVGLWDTLSRQRLLQATGKQTTMSEEEILNLEKQIVRRSDKYADLQASYHVTWKDVRNRLEPHQVAVEYVCFNDGDDEIYYALLLTADSQSPRLIPCCRRSELAGILENYPEGSQKLHSLVWQPVAAHLSTQATEAFIVPAGLLHLVSFAALADGQGKYLCDKIQVRNLMSTRDILLPTLGKSLPSQPLTATLFGGMDSDIAGFDYLPGTEEEVQAAGKLLTQSGWKTNIFTGNQATKKQLQGSLAPASPALMHISTHGYYKPEVTSANPLARSGLVFTGINDVLTAQEVSNLDFSSTHLVVLSACHTGRGNIDNNEGVYGFQRAFRLAGAGSIVTTLWEIPDSDTAMFMTAFYQQLSTGIPVWKAFAAAREMLMKKYPGDFYKWGSFVLIE